MVKMSQPQPLTFPYKKVDDRTNYVDVFVPPLSSKSSLRIVLYFHGGGLTVGNRKSWFPHWIYERAMRAGYAFISADYTLLAPTNGHDLLEDIKDVFRYLDKELNEDIKASGAGISVDASAVIVSGSSAGGLCAYLAALHAVPKPRGVLSLYGQGGNLLSPQYLSIKTVPFLLGREILDPDTFRDYSHPFPPELKPTSDSPLAYNASHHPTAPGMPANLRMQLCRLYLQLGVFLDYYTGEHNPSLSSRLRSVLEAHDDPEMLTETLHGTIPEKHKPLFPQFLVDSSFPPTFLLHGELDSAVHLEESRTLARLLSANGVKHTIRVTCGEEHSFDYAQGALEKHASAFDEVFDFIKDTFDQL